jgi:hypothetical protein
MKRSRTSRREDRAAHDESIERALRGDLSLASGAGAN